MLFRLMLEILIPNFRSLSKIHSIMRYHDRVVKFRMIYVNSILKVLINRYNLISGYFLPSFPSAVLYISSEIISALYKFRSPRILLIE